MDSFLELVNPAVRMAAPLLLAAMGGFFTQRAGIFNIGLDGFMLTGAFCSVVAVHVTGSLILGVLIGMTGGMAAALLMGVLVLSFDADEIVVGIAINLLAIGLTAYLLQELTDGSSVLSVADGLPKFDLGPVASVPVIGVMLQGQSLLVLAALLAVPAVALMMRRSALGLAIRAVGEDADAARSAGIDVKRTRYAAFLWCGALSGLAGTQLALGALSLFAIDLTAGRGIIAFGAVIFGGASAGAVALAAVLFGLADALANQLQRTDVPTQLVLMLPYLATIAMLLVPSGLRRWSRGRRGSKDMAGAVDTASEAVHEPV